MQLRKAPRSTMKLSSFLMISFEDIFCYFSWCIPSSQPLSNIQITPKTNTKLRHHMHHSSTHQNENHNTVQSTKAANDQPSTSFSRIFLLIHTFYLLLLCTFFILITVFIYSVLLHQSNKKPELLTTTKSDKNTKIQITQNIYTPIQNTTRFDFKNSKKIIETIFN